MRKISIGFGAALLAVTVTAQAQTLGDAAAILKQVTAPAAAPATTPAAAVGTTTASPKASSAEMNSGLKLALSTAADAVVGQLGKPGGFANDANVKIGLPGPLAKLDGVLGLLDSTGLTKGLSGKLNSAAEGAVSKALPLLKKSITSMSVADAAGIVTGGPTAATDYFKRTMGASLQAEMAPVVSKSLTGVDAFTALNGVIAKSKLPVGQFGPKDLTNYVTQKASDGVFYYLAEQEKQIRANPLGVGSSLIAKVFGGK